MFPVIVLLFISIAGAQEIQLTCGGHQTAFWGHGDPRYYPDQSGAFLACGYEGFTLYVESPDNLTSVTLKAVDENGVAFPGTTPAAISLCSQEFKNIPIGGPIGGSIEEGNGPEIVVEQEIPASLPVDTSFWDNYDDVLAGLKSSKQKSPKAQSAITFNFDQCGMQTVVENNGSSYGHQVWILVREHLYFNGVIEKVTKTLLKITCNVNAVQHEPSIVNPCEGQSQADVCQTTSYRLFSTCSTGGLFNMIYEQKHPHDDAMIGFQVDNLVYANNNVIIANGSLTDFGETVGGAINPPGFSIEPPVTLYEVRTDVLLGLEEQCLAVGARVNFCSTGAASDGVVNVCDNTRRC